MTEVAALWTHADWLFICIEFWGEVSRKARPSRAKVIAGVGERDGGVKDEGMEEWEVED